MLVRSIRGRGAAALVAIECFIWPKGFCLTLDSGAFCLVLDAFSRAFSGAGDSSPSLIRSMTSCGPPYVVTIACDEVNFGVHALLEYSRHDVLVQSARMCREGCRRCQKKKKSVEARH